MKRRLIQAPKFIFFDIGIVSQLTRRGQVKEVSELFGKAFEHFILKEVTAYCSYFNRRYPLSYWRTASQLEVDLIVDDHLALEIKGTDRVNDRHLKGLRAFKEEHQAQGIIISRDRKAKKTDDNILILPWEEFLKRLWSHEIIT